LSWYLQLKCFIDCLALKMEALGSSETSVTIYRWTRCNISEDLYSRSLLYCQEPALPGVRKIPSSICGVAVASTELISGFLQCSQTYAEFIRNCFAADHIRFLLHTVLLHSISLRFVTYIVEKTVLNSLSNKERKKRKKLKRSDNITYRETSVYLYRDPRIKLL
jgi:hypothetical protein